MSAPRALFVITLLTLWIATGVNGAEPSPVSGTFTVEGKPAKLAFLRAVKGEPFDNKPTTVLVFTEKDASKDAKPDFHASFGQFGNSLTITVFDDGTVIGCEVSHTALKHKSFSSSGEMKTEGFKKEGSTIEGKLTTGGEKDVFGQKWEVNLTFKTKAP